MVTSALDPLITGEYQALGVNLPRRPEDEVHASIDARFSSRRRINLRIDALTGCGKSRDAPLPTDAAFCTLDKRWPRSFTSLLPGETRMGAGCGKSFFRRLLQAASWIRTLILIVALPNTRNHAFFTNSIRAFTENWWRHLPC